ncbi:RNA-binding protein 41 [Lacerta agilis]|uniref:RNA-binding protein 41 n=1 Tax=Lacerta agilis TaxID=80427 RepID=UPI001419DF22|nr:RNA-binding protein 41 [Lacerta agilis]
MRRVDSRHSRDDIPLEDQETEGQRQLKSLLHHQLDTSVSIEQCVSKRRCFAPAALYKPFGEEAAGTCTLPQFQALQESNKEAAALRELGLSDAEIQFWKSHALADKSPGLGAAPEAIQERIGAIKEKMAERRRILSLPQRFAGSKQLSRREMEIESSLFQGTDRHAFLRVLYHQGAWLGGPGVLVGGHGRQLGEVAGWLCCFPSGADEATQEDPLSHLSTTLGRKPEGLPLPPQSDPDSSCPTPPSSPPKSQHADPQPTPAPVMVTEPVEFIPEEDIRKNRLSEEEIRQIPRFSSYSPGEPSEVLYLKNLSRRVNMKELLSLFARFQEEGGPQIQFRLLSGRMRGQAFLTFPSISTAQAALQLANGFILLGKPVVIEYGRKKTP